ncbi:hypothetical protein CDL15_Pgr027369 [Punica granatum]|uniref:Uncharacterized protein n=1 Tax=Punica granatum TaxID=22663 RepID=A0A218Y2W3_PUNGR|nr:hypothetical protein CDL15_Pgr027369 [Punica granatum]
MTNYTALKRVREISEVERTAATDSLATWERKAAAGSRAPVEQGQIDFHWVEERSSSSNRARRRQQGGKEAAAAARWPDEKERETEK